MLLPLSQGLSDAAQDGPLLLSLLQAHQCKGPAPGARLDAAGHAVPCRSSVTGVDGQSIAPKFYQHAGAGAGPGVASRAPAAAATSRGAMLLVLEGMSVAAGVSGHILVQATGVDQAASVSSR